VDAILWRRDGGALAYDFTYFGPVAVSADGRIMAGDTAGNAFLWEENPGGAPALVLFDEQLDHRGSYVTQMTPDGVFVVGASGYDAYRFSRAGGLEPLAPRPENAYAMEASAVSADGSAIAGLTYASDDIVVSELFHWSAPAQLQIIASPPTQGLADTLDYVNDVYFPRLRLSADGATVVGTLGDAADSTKPRAFRWAAAGGAVPLEPGRDTVARDASRDAGVIVGYSVDGDDREPFVWSVSDGFRSLRAVLANAGVAMDGWQLDEPSVVSADGRVIVGQGSCGGVRTSYRVTLPE
jgi:hypothetical protein